MGAAEPNDPDGARFYRKRGGEWIKKLRESKVTSTYADGTPKCMTQRELAAALQEVWFRHTQEWRIWGDKDIRLLEGGQVARVSRLLFECVGEALGASPYERLLLLEAAGYATLSDFVLMALGIKPRGLGIFTVGVAADRDLSVEEAIKVMELEVRYILQRVERRIRGLIRKIESTAPPEEGDSDDE